MGGGSPNPISLIQSMTSGKSLFLVCIMRIMMHFPFTGGKLIFGRQLDTTMKNTLEKAMQK